MSTTTAPTQRTTTSADGTRIAWWTSGTGPDLLMVHGTTADHTRWEAMLPLLEPRVTVHAMDRRGRGASGDRADFSLEREVEDVAAVAEAIGAPVHVFGHSQGALYSLEASTLTTAIGRLVLYEPPVGVAAPPETRRQLAALVSAGRRDEAVAYFLVELAGLTPEQVEQSRSLPSWAGRVAAAHTIVREEEICATYRFDPSRFSGSGTPALLLDGTASPAALRAATARVAQALPNSQVVPLVGHGHVAMLADPGLVAEEILGFVERT
ncbi:alpha/beta fold hydrolase [Blastococcus tunisiensis]|uniref:Pimeloyl-ACP methyl ester carboxylesterase n=1 Tax=Blastococcus tunisiensis TaxID=1798228 RepID=A0A1I1Z7X4_9ACTN|nr:alpha/beta hydrolase [Blastococcus sp. DSM 46838]SFE27652.1 Pimeloyl-ACP methyl ester carboxylesterase [Blastococcus sp. DSM 46838]